MPSSFAFYPKVLRGSIIMLKQVVGERNCGFGFLIFILERSVEETVRLYAYFLRALLTH